MKIKIPKEFFLFLLVICFSSKVTAVTVSGFGDGTGYALNGNTSSSILGVPAISGGVLTLTNEFPAESSSCWYDQLISFDQFTASFEFHAGIMDLWNADGFTFAVQDVATTALGGAGGDLGYGGIPSGFAVAFDTWPTFPPMTDDVLSIVQNGDVFTALQEYSVPYELEDGIFHTALINYNMGHVEVILDGVPVLSHTFSSIPLTSGYFGFTGATGGAVNLQQIRNFNLNATEVPEPVTIVLLLSGIFGLSFFKKRK